MKAAESSETPLLLSDSQPEKDSAVCSRTYCHRGQQRLIWGVVLSFVLLALALLSHKAIHPNNSLKLLLEKHGRMETASKDGRLDENRVPWLQISGDRPAPPRIVDWVPRVCMPAYEGPHCSNTTSWKGKVTLQLDGMTIEGVIMHTRGHVSKMFPKHQFSLKLPEPISLLGMAPARKWVLATSFVDTSFQRNPTAFDIHRRVGGWATQTRYENVDWGGKDFGLYYIGERIERGWNRLRIPKSHPKHPEEFGYLLTIDWAKLGEVAIRTPNSSTFFSAVYPKKVSQEQETFLTRFLNMVDDRAATSPSKSHGLTPSLEELIDFKSFARFFITEELAKDVDGYAFSVFVMVKDGRLFHAAPWDFDLAFNFACMPIFFRNAYSNKSTRGVEGWNVENLRDNAPWIGKTGLPGGSLTLFGVNKRQLFLNMWNHPEFRATFVTAWTNARQGALSDQALMDMVRARSIPIKPSVERDLGIWSQTKRCAFWDCCEPSDIRSFDSSSRHLAQYLIGRAAWIDTRVEKLLAA